MCSNTDRIFRNIKKCVWLDACTSFPSASDPAYHWPPSLLTRFLIALGCVPSNLSYPPLSGRPSGQLCSAFGSFLTRGMSLWMTLASAPGSIWIFLLWVQSQHWTWAVWYAWISSFGRENVSCILVSEWSIVLKEFIDMTYIKVSLLFVPPEWTFLYKKLRYNHSCQAIEFSYYVVPHTEEEILDWI